MDVEINQCADNDLLAKFASQDQIALYHYNKNIYGKNITRYTIEDEIYVNKESFQLDDVTLNKKKIKPNHLEGADKSNISRFHFYTTQV